MPRLAMWLVSGNLNEHPFQRINENLEVVGTTFALLNTAAQSKGGLDAAMNQVFVAASISSLGTAGPAIIGGALILVYKTAITLFVGFGPLFILCYGFQSTKQLASKWLYYGIGTLFSMALLSFMVALVTKIVVAVGLMMIAKYAILVTLQGSEALEGINTMAMQQGGIGLIMTVLLISCPPLAAQFFNATVGQFSAYSQFGIERGGGQRDAAGNPVGGSNRVESRRFDDTNRDDKSVSHTSYNTNTRTMQSSQDSLQRDAIKTEEEIRNRRT